MLAPPADPKRPPVPNDVVVPNPPRLDPKPPVPPVLNENAGFDVAVLPNNPVDVPAPKVLVPKVLVPEDPKPNGFEVAPKRPAV